MKVKSTSELLAPKAVETHKAIVSQLFYTVGPLSNYDANGQIGRVETSAVTETIEGDTKRITYTVKLPVAWPKNRAVPTSHVIVLPKDTTKLAAFDAKYVGKCGDDRYGPDAFWHDFDPVAASCTLDDADVTRSNARVTKNKRVTTGKYPEYALVWEDGVLDVVAIFAYSDHGGAADEGEQQFDAFVTASKALFPGATSTEARASASIHKDVTVKAKVKVGGALRDVSITSLLIGTLYTSGADFDARYGALSARADLVAFNGPAGLSKNTNALPRKGTVLAKQYQLFFFDSGDTYAYLDTTLTDRRRDVNGASDPKGTRYLDVVTNVLPTSFESFATSSLSFVKALSQRDAPKTYGEIMTELPPELLVVVTGEEDNTFTP